MPSDAILGTESSAAPELTLVLCSRNDQYMGNSRWRLETTLNYTAEQVAALGLDDRVEILVSDWGSTEPLHDVVALNAEASRISRFLWIPPAVAAAHQGDSPFPEVLALNTAVRRARGRYIGRIDQDTLVGRRFLELFFSWTSNGWTEPSGPERVLLFSNRRSIPYRFAVCCPSLPNVTRFVNTFGSRLRVWRHNVATGDVFWTSYVGILLAHRRIWETCGGYDERLIYYNWMETDLICRLRARHPVVDLGQLTQNDFYHLEHFSGPAGMRMRRRSVRNAVVDLANPPAAVHPNGPAWGLLDEEVPVRSVRPTPNPHATVQGNRGIRTAAVFAALLALTAGQSTLDAGVVRALAVWSAVTRHRLQFESRCRRMFFVLRDTPVLQWPLVTWRLWASRKGMPTR